MGVTTTLKWALREMMVAKRLPVFSWHVWMLMMIFVFGVVVGMAIGLDQADIISEAMKGSRLK